MTASKAELMRRQEGVGMVQRPSWPASVEFDRKGKGPGKPKGSHNRIQVFKITLRAR